MVYHGSSLEEGRGAEGAAQERLSVRSVQEPAIRAFLVVELALVAVRRVVVWPAFSEH